MILSCAMRFFRKEVNRLSAGFGNVVCACIKLKAGVQFDENFLRESLALHLAKYKIPEYFMVCESFSLLGSGKVNGAALKQLATKKFSRR